VPESPIAAEAILSHAKIDILTRIEISKIADSFRVGGTSGTTEVQINIIIEKEYAYTCLWFQPCLWERKNTSRGCWNDLGRTIGETRGFPYRETRRGH
jgi:hypothetical protein